MTAASRYVPSDQLNSTLYRYIRPTLLVLTTAETYADKY